jgi:hypothetical protein
MADGSPTLPTSPPWRWLAAGAARPTQLAAHRDRIVQLKKEYDERRDFRIKPDLDPVLAPPSASAA